jgi:polysaccharide export outer membrane protein
MTKYFINLLLIIVCTGTLHSCVTNRKTTYLQSDGINTISTPPTGMTESTSYRIQPSDNLYIRVITPDPKWAVMFNTLPVTSSTFSITEQSTDLISYPVLPDGNIDMPYVGEIAVAGKTLQEIKKILELALAEYINDYDVTVRLVNNYVSVLGDVNNPGRYAIYKDKMNIFQAMAMAGDMGDYSDRYTVKIVRETQEGTRIMELDLTKKEVINSEFFM